MGASRGAADRGFPGRLDDRVLETLQGLHGRLAFSGLRRVLGAHPESLTRALNRLEREGLVERVDGGYRALDTSLPVGAPAAEALRSIARVELPPSISSPTLLARLAGRWFGSLRWVGTIDRPSQRLLAWARRDGNGLALLGAEGGFLQVYVPSGTSAGDPAEAEDAAYELLFHAVEAVRPSPDADTPDGIMPRMIRAGPPPWALDN